MKEFTSQTGGRFTYVDDLLNLQELALAFSEIFTDCDNFIVSGCEVNGNSISSGIVYLNGKLRTVEAVPAITGGWPQFIYEKNENKTVPYASGGEKIGREIWGTSVGKTVPVDVTPLTDAVPKAIQINATGGLRMKDAWFGKYALLLTPAANTQSVNGHVNFQTLLATGAIQSNSRYVIHTASGTGTLYMSGSNLVLQASLSGNQPMQMIFGADNSFRFVINGVGVATITATGITFSRPVTCSHITCGNVVVDGNDIYNASSASNAGSLDINVLGHNGSSTYYRITNIGDGKGSIVLSISGASKTITASGQVIVRNNASLAQIFRGTITKSNVAYQQYVEWQDSTSASMAQLGYLDNNNMIYTIKNLIGGVLINGVGGVNIGPYIMEGGTQLSAKYASKKTTETELGKKANAADVYAKTDTYSTTQANDKFAAKSSGFIQFIVGSNTAEALCSQIGAMRQSDLDNYVRKNKFLSDMALTDADKATIRNNIGAAAKNEVQKDTGWVNISGTSLYARQIGDIVCIQGLLKLMHSGQAFAIPNNIQAPRFAVGYDAPMPYSNTYWSCRINAGEKACNVVRCNAHDNTVPISITYMV